MRSDFIYTLLHERTTVEMSALSADMIICTYPGATTDRKTYPNKSLRSAANVTSSVYRKHAVSVINPSTNLFRPCGIICPFLNRTTTALKHFALFHWQMKLRRVTEETDYLWRLGKICRNASCEHFNISVLGPETTLFGHRAYLITNINGMGCTCRYSFQTDYLVSRYRSSRLAKVAIAFARKPSQLCEAFFIFWRMDLLLV